MPGKLDRSYDALEASMDKYRKSLSEIANTVHNRKVRPICHPEMVLIRAEEIPTEVDLSSSKERVVVVLTGKWMFINGKFSRELVQLEQQVIPAGTPAVVRTDEEGAECCYFEI